MLALRLARRAHVLVQVRRLLVAAASAGTGFLLLCAFGYALGHPGAPAGAALRLAWCAVPAAATVHLAVAVARADPGTRPRPGLSAIGLGPGRLMAFSALTTALSCALGSAAALLLFLHLRGDLPGLPPRTSLTDALAKGLPLPLPATATLLTVVPLVASAASALTLRPRRDTAPPTPADLAAEAAPVGDGGPPRSNEVESLGEAPGKRRQARPRTSAPAHGALPVDPDTTSVPTPSGLPWGLTVIAAGLTTETYAARTPRAPSLDLPGDLAATSAAVLAGWALTAVGLALAGPALTHLCGRLLQSARPGALRLLAGRVLQEEATRIGRPLGVLCAVASGAYATARVYAAAHGAPPAFGPLSSLGALLVAGCALATLATAAVEARRDRAGTTAALLRIGAPATLLRAAALLRTTALLVVLAPLTWLIAELAALPLTR
ncbi:MULTISPECIES: hypothetical protein [unclassified Streptomyces]|uniref:hypothetical protein n=1 Tax=unclassified Streptomyces TaxID=2593676 RepID=UPI0004C13954|nr:MULTISPECIES: hypothetical protein [unclassified Streptomyces]